MIPFSTNYAKRTTAFVALLTWLFALGSGMANACSLAVPVAHVHSGAEHASAVVARVAPGDEVQVLESGDHHHHEDGDVSKDACAKTCDTGSNAPAKLKTGFDWTNPGTAFLVTTEQLVLTPVISTRHRLDDMRRPVDGPPLRVRYSRLAL